jgi:uncharacterized cupin superfamily protein
VTTAQKYLLGTRKKQTANRHEFLRQIAALTSLSYEVELQPQDENTCMPKIDTSMVAAHTGSDYPAPLDAPCAARTRTPLGGSGGLRDFGVNLLNLPPGCWSSQRHWHSHEDEFVYVLEGEVALIEDDGEKLLRAGECAAFPKANGNGHHLINRSSATAVLLEVGSRHPLDVTTYSDVDMMVANEDGRYVHKDGTPYPPQ